MSELWIMPIVPQDHWVWFGTWLAISTAVTVTASPHRRTLIGALGVALGRISQLSVPLAGVILVRAGYRHAYLAEGQGFWSAMWLSLFWMMAFVFVGRWLVKTLPPTSYWIQDLQKAERDVWVARLKRWFSVPVRRPQ